MDNYKRKNKEETIEDSQFDPEEFYTALRKNIGYDELHPEKVKAAIKAYNPNLNLTENQIREVIKMYQKRKGR